MTEIKPHVDEKFPSNNFVCIYIYYFSLSCLLVGLHVSLFHGCGGLCVRHERDVTRVDANSLLHSLFLYLCLLILISLSLPHSFSLCFSVSLSLYLPDMAVMELLRNNVVCLLLLLKFKMCFLNYFPGLRRQLWWGQKGER